MLKRKFLTTVLVFAVVFGTVANTVTVYAEDADETAGLEITVEESVPNEKPQVTVDSVTWNGGWLEIPVHTGDYSAESVSADVLYEKNDGTGTTRTNIGLGIIQDQTMYVDVNLARLAEYPWMLSEYPFQKAGTYELKVILNFDNMEIGEDTVNVIVNESSDSWYMEEQCPDFDGSQDLSFTFQNGTNHLELQSISSIKLYTVKTAAIEGYTTPVLTEGNGYSYDLKAGTLTIDKDVLKKAITDYVAQGGPMPDDNKIAFNAIGVTKDGEEVRFNTVEGSRDGFRVSVTAWWADISNLDLDASTDPTPTEPIAPVGTFTGTTAEEVTVSAETGSQIKEYALSYIQKNYADQLAVLGNDYTVSSKLNVTKQEDTSVSQDVKDAFAACRPGAKIAQYYELSIRADVIKDGVVVDGLSDIPIPELEKKITVSIKIPEELNKSGRTYTVLHFHDGKAYALETTTKDGVVSFETDSFSPYTLVYEESTKVEGTKTESTKVEGTKSESSKTENTKSGSPKTGDGVNFVGIASALFLSLMAVVILLLKKKRFEK